MSHRSPHSGLFTTSAGAVSALAAIIAAAADCATGGVASVVSSLGGKLLLKALEFTGTFGQGVVGDVLKHHLSTPEDYRQVHENHDLEQVLHQAVADTCKQVADRIAPDDRDSAAALRFMAGPDGRLSPMESLRLVEVFATTAAELGAGAEGAEGGGETLTLDEWRATFERFVLRAEDTREWRQKRHYLSPDAKDEVARTLHRGFPRAARNVVAQDAETGGRAFAKLVLLMLGETLALVREVKANSSSSDLSAQAADLEQRLSQSETAFREALSDELRAQLRPVLDRLDRLKDHVTDQAGRVIERADQRFDRIEESQERTQRTLEQLALDQIRATNATAPSLAPLQKTAHFVGRAEAIAETLQALDDCPVVFVCGPGGIGKSTLVRHLYDLARAKPWAADGADYFDLAAQTSADGVIGAVASLLSLVDVRDAHTLVQRLAGRGARLYILDDLHQALKADYDGVCALLTALTTYDSEIRFLVTMRSKPDVASPRTVHPGKLLPPHDADLFRALTADRPRHDGESGALTALLRGLDGYPLAIELAAGRLPADGSVSRLLDAWNERHTRLLEHVGRRKDRLSSIDVSLDLSYAELDHLPDEARALFVTFADLPAGASPPLLEALLGFDGESTAEALLRLGLLHRDGDRYAALVPIQHFAASKRGGVSGADALRQRLDAYLLAFARTAGDRERWIRDDGTILRAVQAELPTLFAALDRATAREDDRYVAEVTDGVRKMLTWEFGQSDTLPRLSAALEASEREGSTQIAANLHYSFAEAQRLRSEYDEARERYTAARDTYRDIGDRLGEANAEKGLGEVNMARDEYDEARERYTAARDTYRDIGDRLGEADAEEGLGDVHLMRDEYDEARERYTAARDAYQAIGSRRAEASAEKGLGDVHRMRDEYDEARERYTAARDTYRDIGDRLGEASAEQGLGDVHLMRDEYDEARERYTAARDAYQAIGSRLGEASAEKGLGKVNMARDEYDEARERYTAARDTYRDIGDRLGEADAEQGLGDVHLMRDEYDEARERYTAARDAYQAIGDRLGEANAEKGLGKVNMARDEYDEARERYTAARDTYRDIGDRLGEASAEQGLGDVHRMRDEYDEARERYTAARDAYQAIGSRLGEASAEQGLGDVHRMRGEYDEARERYTAARDAYQAIGSRLGEASAEQGLGDVHRMRDEYDEARERYTAARDTYRDIGDRLGEANAEQGLGDVHRMRGEYDEARERYTAARDAYQAIGDRLGEANAEKGLGKVNMARGEYDEAHERYYAARTLFEAIGDSYSIASVLMEIGKVYALTQRPTEAVAAWEESISRSEALSLGELPPVQTMRAWIEQFRPDGGDAGGDGASG